MYPFENATFSLRIRLPSTRIRWKRSIKTELFENALQSGTFWKRCFRVYAWTNENETFRTLRSHYQFHSTPRNIRNVFKMADGRFPFLSFNTYASSMRSRVSYCFQIDSSYTCGRAKTLQVDADFLKTEKKSCVFKRIRIRVDGSRIRKEKVAFSNGYMWTGP